MRSRFEILVPSWERIVSFAIIPPRKIVSIGAREISLSFFRHFSSYSHAHAYTHARTILSLSLLEENFDYSRIGNFKYTNRRIISAWNRAKLDRGVLFHPNSPTIRIEDTYIQIYIFNIRGKGIIYTHAYAIHIYIHDTSIIKWIVAIV